MNTKQLATLLATLILMACDDNVPKVDDPHKVVVDDKSMTQAAFLEKYCVGKIANQTCDQVAHAMSTDATTKGKIPAGW